jgi:UDP-N-acetylglucosamine diphosphorylase / glucose-1-phosphate thymidylyltransferase / UDP-N-acetylgalactosamine diphosphorylase / glucosamine-1-phosphate N-acetyltransferase / galactosamine-1-phosphate N-acetyltransferase
MAENGLIILDASKTMFAPTEFLTLEHTAHPKLFENQKYVWEALKQIASYLQFRLKPAVLGELVGKPFISRNVFIGAGTIVEQGAVLKGPAWVGENCHIRSGCYVRENVIVGDSVVMGNSCEFKNCILFDEAQVPHFNYVGDSILGYHAHLGAGVILSNVKLDHGEIAVATDDGGIATGLTKFGAIVGDRTEIGCNAVINPGAILGRDCIIYPGANFRGVLPASSIVKVRQELQVLSRRDQKAE